MSDDSDLPTCIEVDPAAQGTYLFSFLDAPQTLGIFVPTDAPYAEGTPIYMRFSPPDSPLHRHVEPFQLEGHVVWVSRSEQGIASGMGVRFSGMEDGVRDILLALTSVISFFN